MDVKDVITPQEDPAGKLAEFAAQLQYEDIPKEHVEYIKKDILDAIGCMIGGSVGPVVPTIAEAARTWASEGKGKTVVYGDPMPIPLAGFVNGTMARAWDMGDTGVKGGHICEWIVPALLTQLAGTENPISGKQMLTAFAAGAEWGAREHVVTRLQYHTIIPPGECAGSRYAAVALAKLLEFDKEQIWNTAGMVFSAHSQHESQKYVEGTSDARIQHGFVVQDALQAVSLVEKGIKSIHGIYMGHGALLKNIKHGDLESPDLLYEDLGSRWVWKEGITQKRYTGCYYNHTPIWGVLSLMKEHGIKREEIAGIKITTSFGGITVHSPIEKKRHPDTAEQAMWSSPYTLTQAVFTGDCFINAFQEETFAKNMGNPEFTEFMQKIEYEYDSNIVTAFDNYPITIRLKDGREFSKIENTLPGNVEHPLTWEQVIEKFWKCTKYAAVPMDEGKCKKTIEICRNMEKSEDVRELFDTLVP